MMAEHHKDCPCFTWLPLNPEINIPEDMLAGSQTCHDRRSSLRYCVDAPGAQHSVSFDRIGPSSRTYKIHAWTDMTSIYHSS